MNYLIERLDLNALVPRLGAGQRFTDELFQFALAIENASNDKILLLFNLTAGKIEGIGSLLVC
jgi:hypothetical protein